MEQQTNSVTTSTALELLKNPCRKALLQQLILVEQQPVHLDHLIGLLPDGNSPEAQAQFKTELHHIHLPKLADADVIAYNQTDETISYRSTRKIEKLIDFIDTSL